MKKFLSLAMLIILVVSLSACGQDGQAAGSSDDKQEVLYKVVSEYDANENGIKMTAEYDKNSNLLALYDTDNPDVQYGDEEYAQRGILLKNTGYNEAGEQLWYAEFYDKHDEENDTYTRAAKVYNKDGQLQNSVPAEQPAAE